jgi:hypothetical protein
MEVQVKVNNSRSNSSGVTVYSVHLKKFKSEEVSEILAQLRSCREGKKENTWTVHPVPISFHQLEGDVFYLEPSLALNRIFAEQATFLQQIEFLSHMGVTEAIDRRPDLRVAVSYHQFCSKLARNGIINASFEVSVLSSIKRIHAVHSIFLEDPEVLAGLQIPFSKNQRDTDQVLYVCNPETLELAIAHCERNTVLTIDGHWEHGKKATHGVWETSNAEEIALELTNLLRKYPGKIHDIRLLGCESGFLSSFHSLPTEFQSDSILFKDECVPSFLEKEMAEFRNRAIYYSRHGEFPFATDSLAGSVLRQLAGDLSSEVVLTAAPSRTYPYPVSTKSRFNIGSDSLEWSDSGHFWDNPIKSDLEIPEWYRKLNRLKVITVLSEKHRSTSTSSEWSRKLMT